MHKDIQPRCWLLMNFSSLQSHIRSGKKEVVFSVLLWSSTKALFLSCTASTPQVCVINVCFSWCSRLTVHGKEWWLFNQPLRLTVPQLGTSWCSYPQLAVQREPSLMEIQETVWKSSRIQQNPEGIPAQQRAESDAPTLDCVLWLKLFWRAFIIVRAN